jgi:hypothetical protein
MTDHTGSVNGVMYSPDGNQIITYSWYERVRIWDVETGDCTYTLPGHGSFNNFVFSPRDNQVAATNDDGTVRVWNVGTGECHGIFIGHNDRAWSIAYSPNGGQIASGGEDGSVRIWDTTARTCIWMLSGHSDEVKRIVYSSQGDLVVSASNDGSVRVWDVMSGQCGAVIQDFQDGVNDVVWIESLGVNSLVAGCFDGVVGEDQCDVSLRWKTTNGELDIKDETIQDVQGLSHLNRKLLKQQGALGEPADLLAKQERRHLWYPNSSLHRAVLWRVPLLRAVHSQKNWNMRLNRGSNRQKAHLSRTYWQLLRGILMDTNKWCFVVSSLRWIARTMHLPTFSP